MNNKDMQCCDRSHRIVPDVNIVDISAVSISPPVEPNILHIDVDTDIDTIELERSSQGTVYLVYFSDDLLTGGVERLLEKRDPLIKKFSDGCMFNVAIENFGITQTHLIKIDPREVFDNAMTNTWSPVVTCNTQSSLRGLVGSERTLSNVNELKIKE